MTPRHLPVPAAAGRSGERGSALVIAILVTVILALLGIAFLLMGETENRIAENEKLSAQALYAAEAAARTVKRWFDEPGTALGFPAVTEVDRSLRQMIDPTDPYNAAKMIDPGGVGWTAYRQTSDTIFERPYRGSPEDDLLGTELGPDIRIDDGDPTIKPFLDGLSQMLWGDFPGEGGGVQTRISRIDVYAPPYVQVGANWNRYGMATLSVVVRIYRALPGRPVETIAEREVRAVLSEAPYYGPYGPLHSCSNLTVTGPLQVSWGALTAERDTKLSTVLSDIPTSLPRGLPAAPRQDPPWTSVSADYAAFVTAMDGGILNDPWLRSLSGGALWGAAIGVPQPYKVSPPVGFDHSNLMQQVSVVGCPEYDYDVWKTFATSGERDVHYFTWDGGTGFQENGVGASRTFQQITNLAEGVYFFDTRDRLPPRDNDGDGLYDNLTPTIALTSGAWEFKGVVYLNADRFEFGTHQGASVTLFPPGEPYLDSNQNGSWDTGEPWLNLDYGPPIRVDASDSWGGSVMRNDRGPGTVAAFPVVQGILYTNGFFEATGSAVFYGSVIARQGVVQALDDGSAPTPTIYWDESIVSGFPPAGWDLPRTMITGWMTDR